MDATLDRVEEENEDEYEEGDNEYNRDDEDQYSEEELNILERSDANNSNSKRNSTDPTDGGAYQNPLRKPIGVIGNTKICLSTAKLFGIKLDENGNLQHKNEQKKKNPMDYIKNISRPRDTDLSDIPREPEPTFKPSKTKEAMNAMLNKKCGYDFVERLNEREDFWGRMYKDAAESKKLSKWELEKMKDDYEARLDKLICPNCRKPQSFDEFFEKKRNCSQCKMKYEKLNVTSGQSYLKRVQVAEEKKLQRLREVEKVMYGNKANFRSPFEDRLSSSTKKKPDRDVPVFMTVASAPTKVPISRENTGKPYQMKVSKDGVYRNADKVAENDDDIDAMVQRLMQKQQPQEYHKPQEIIRKISVMNKEKNVLIDKTLAAMVDQQKQQKSQPNANIASARERPSSAPATRRKEIDKGKEGSDRERDDISKKLQKLLA